MRYLLMGLVTTWIAGSAFIVTNAWPQPKACAWPFYTYAATWPVWATGYNRVTHAIIAWSLARCEP